MKNNFYAKEGNWVKPDNNDGKILNFKSGGLLLCLEDLVFFYVL